MTSDITMQNLLTEITDAVLAEEDVEAVRARYAVPRHEADEFVRLIQSLPTALPPVAPSPQFQKRLKAELLGQAEPPVVRQLRGLPARVQWAAVLAVFGGLLLLVRRFFLGENRNPAPKLADSENALKESQ